MAQRPIIRYMYAEFVIHTRLGILDFAEVHLISLCNLNTVYNDTFTLTVTVMHLTEMQSSSVMT